MPPTEERQATVRLRVLGGATLQRDGELVVGRPAQRHHLAILAYLAAAPGGHASRDKVIACLWPEQDTAKARHRLSVALHVLRQGLGDDCIITSGDGIALNQDCVEADLVCFREALDEGRLEDAVEHYGGPFLDGFFVSDAVEFEQWTEVERLHLSGLYRTALEQLAADAERAGDVGASVRWWRRLATHDRYSSSVALGLMRALVAMGDVAAAVGHARTYATLVEGELDVPADPEVAEFAEELVKADNRTNHNAARAKRTLGPATGDAPFEPKTNGDGRVDGAAPLLGIGPGLVISRLIGRGATGTVYLAQEPSLKRLVAVKVLHADLAQNPTARARFEREAQAAARISHPNVATVYRVGTTGDERPYLVMQYVKGVTLADRMKAAGPFPPDEVRRLLVEASAALAAAHEAGVIHRDVRPANFIYQEGTGRTYLTDFGVAGVLESGTEEIIHLTRTGELLGNAEYMSPEQARGDKVDDRSDIYGLGMLGRALLFGHALAKNGSKECPDRHLIDTLERATSKESRHRPSARAMEAALKQ